MTKQTRSDDYYEGVFDVLFILSDNNMAEDAISIMETLGITNDDLSQSGIDEIILDIFKRNLEKVR